MKTVFTLTALATALALGACASSNPEPPAELVRARNAVHMAETDPVVLSSAQLELKKATEALAQANELNAKGKNLADISTASYIAERAAQTALEVARTKRQEDAAKNAQIERERTRADLEAAEARRAQQVAASAQARASLQGARAAYAEQRADSAEAQAAAAQASAADAQQRALMARQEAEALQKQLAEVKATPTDRGMLVTLGDVLFEFNRAEVKPTARGELAKVAEFLRQHPDRRILVEGFTDNVGSAEYNVDLSRRRAEAVAAALVSLGVPADRVQSAGYGKDYPVADNATDTNRAMNRRVEVYISNNAQPVQPRRG
jgi:outer membrane protein OmpA-like peptidoglycan-associated protein